MELSSRLEAILAMADPGCRVADIGTDHAFLPIELVRRGIALSAVAMDVREGPLERATAHVQEAGLSERIVVRLSDGLDKLLPGEADTVVISGMGGRLMVHILERRAHVDESIKTWILSPHSEAEWVRRYLNEQGLILTNEDLVQEDGKFYPVMKAAAGPDRVRDAGRMRVLDSGEDFTVDERYGPELIRRRHPVLREYLTKRLEVNRKILESLAGQDGEKALRRRQEILRESEEWKELYQRLQTAEQA